jgi:hypothetical protein
MHAVQYSRDKARYFSWRFWYSIVGTGTADRDLMRLTVSRCETDLGYIKIIYNDIFGETLSHAVSVSIIPTYILGNVFKIISYLFFIYFYFYFFVINRKIRLDLTAQLY